jgi:hypothetical protein
VNSESEFRDLKTPSSPGASPGPRAAPGTNTQTHKLRILLPGISKASPLGRQLLRSVSELAEIVMTGQPCATNPWWRWKVRHTLLDWFGPTETGADAAAPARVLLDLHGAENRQGLRTWRVVDAFGRPVLQPSGVTTPTECSLVTSLYLIESTAGRAGWFSLADVHLSARRRDGKLLDAVGRAVVWLVATAIRADRASTKPQCLLRFEPLSPTLAGGVAAWMRRAKAILRDHFASDVWAIGCIAEPIGNFLNSRTVSATSWLEIPTAEGFVADPFPWPGRDGAILYERFSHRTGRGTIEALVPDSNGERRVLPLGLNIPSHLSYPCTYADSNLVLCLPEMFGERRQLIYRLAPDAPPAVHALVAEDVAMADPTLFRHDGLHWIAYNDAQLGMHENLCLLYAKRLEGPWLPHPHNPVKMDVRSSRPGGTPFVVDGALFRPAQDCSRSYGCALVINKVLICNPEQYREEPIARLRPDPAGRYPDGCHTLSITSDGILFDGKRIVFNQAIVRQRLQRQLRTRWRRLYGRAN